MEKQRFESSRMDIKRNYWPLRRTWTSKRRTGACAPFLLFSFVLSFHFIFLLMPYSLTISLYLFSLFYRVYLLSLPSFPETAPAISRFRCSTLVTWIIDVLHSTTHSFCLRFQFKDSMLETLFAYMSANENTIRNLIFLLQSEV